MSDLDQPDPSSIAPGPQRSVQRSIFFSAIERYGNLVLFLVTTAVLARLLTPAEFGIYAVVNAVTAVVAASFQEFGGANYLIQKRELSRASVRTAFTVTFGISALIGLALLALSDALSQLFEQESLRKGIAVSALSYLLVPFSGTVTGLFRREMEFGKLAICNLAAGVVGATASIVLAMLNFGFMAPVWGGVAGNMVLTMMLLRWHRDFGAFRPSVAQFRDVVGFGLYSSGVSVINVLYNLSPQLFLAKILDFASVGLYSRATSITQVFDKLVVQVLNPIIMPALVSRNKDAAGLRSAYLEAVELLSVVQWPFLALRRDHGTSDHSDLARSELAGNRAFGSLSLRREFGSVRRLFDLSHTGGHRKRARCANFVFDLPAALASRHSVRCFLWGPGRGSISVADTAVSGCGSVVFHRSTACHRAKTSFSCLAEERRCDGYDRFRSDGLCGADRGEDRTVLRRPDRCVRCRRALLVVRADAHRTSVAASASSSSRWSGRDCAVA